MSELFTVISWKQIIISVGIDCVVLVLHDDVFKLPAHFGVDEFYSTLCMLIFPLKSPRVND